VSESEQKILIDTTGQVVGLILLCANTNVMHHALVVVDGWGSGLPHMKT